MLEINRKIDWYKENRVSSLTGTWVDTHSVHFFIRMISDMKRKFSSTWFDNQTWLRHSKADESLYCVYWFFYLARTLKTNCSVHQPSHWRNLGSYIKRHKSSSSSHHGCVIAGDNFLQIVPQKVKPVASLLSSTQTKQVANNRHILSKMIEVILLCGWQKIAFRRHIEDRSNFTAILNTFAEKRHSLIWALNHSIWIQS